MSEMVGKYSTFSAAISTRVTNNRLATLALNPLPNSRDLHATTQTFIAVCCVSTPVGTQGQGRACVTGAAQLKGTIYISDKMCVCSGGWEFQLKGSLFHSQQSRLFQHSHLYQR